MSAAAQTKVVHFVVNASSGFDAKESLPVLIGKEMAGHALEGQVHPIEKGADICGVVQGLVRDGAEVVVAAGGDGTLNAVATVLATTDVAMGVLPCGTLNHFARDLDIPFEPEKALAVIANGREVKVDVGEVNGKRFINNAIVGLYPAYRFRRERHERRGWHRFLAMISAFIGVFRRNPAMRLRIDCDGQVIERKTPFLMVANNRHEMEGYQLGTRRRLDSGDLSVYVMHRMSRWGLLRLAFSLLIGRFSKRRDFDVMDARSVTVESSRRTIGVSLDGEVVRMQPPLRYQSLAGSLRVIVPPGYKSN